MYISYSAGCARSYSSLIGLRPGDAGCFTRLLSGLAVFTSFVASVMAIFNTVTIVRQHFDMGSGMYVFLISSLVALVCSAMSQSSPFLVPVDRKLSKQIAEPRKRG